MARFSGPPAQTIPATTVTAAAVCRMIAPRPSPNRPIRLRLAPVSTIARRTPGWLRAGGVMPWRRVMQPAKKDRNAAASPVISATAPTTAALAARTLRRRGAAANVARMVPEVYSLVMASTPTTPMSSTPMSMPTSVLPTNMPLLVVLLPIARAMPADAATAMARVSQVERRLRSLIHSIRANCRNRYLPDGWRLAWAVMTCSLPGTGRYHRLVEQQHGRVSQQRRGDAETLRHAERELPGPFARYGSQSDHLQDLGDPGLADGVAGRQRGQVRAGRPARVEGPGFQQSSGLAQPPARLTVGPGAAA